MAAAQPPAVQGDTIRAAGASTELMAAFNAWHAAALAHERLDTDASAHLEQKLRDEFADLADEQDRCQQCLADLTKIEGWTNAYCPDHAHADVLRDYHDWKAQQ